MRVFYDLPLGIRDRYMRFISNYIERGKIGTWTLVYLPLALVEIVAILNTSASGNFAGWVAALLGIIVCFPWFYIGIEITPIVPLRTWHYNLI